MELYEKLEKENEGYIKIFKECLSEEGYSKKTIREHIQNAEHFLYFLSSFEEVPMKEGAEHLSSFYGYHFIYKCFGTPYTMKRYFASTKKFYKCMMEKGIVAQDLYDDVCDTIKVFKDDWLLEAEANEESFDDFLF